MGIPSFYKWLTDKYPRMAVDVIEERPRVVNGVALPVDVSLPNPNGFEFDNLYLDMNGIIHPCFHPEDLPAPTTYDEVFKYIFKYIDRIFSIVRPRKLLYLAIDGVAPRAKMNQQRSRRFMAAKEAAEKALKMEKSEEKPALSEQLKKMDSNVITPGTEFMALLSSALRYYIRLRMNGDSAWRGIKVILSDANVPGEGEHKVLSYIRLQRDLPGYNPNTRHCLYGMDADLIMLALAAHEVHFSILREYVYRRREKVSSLSKGKKGKSKKGNANQTWKKGNANLAKKGRIAENLDDYILGLNFEFLNIWVLREYLEYDMSIPGLTFETELERLIDDFVLMCLFVGNDFLPHLPTLAISEGAIDLLMMVYKKEFVKMGGYLTDSFQINLARVEHFIQAVSSYEGAIFRKRSQIMKEKKQRFLNRKLAKLLQNDRNSHSTSHGSSPSVEESGGMNFEDSIHRLSKEADILADKMKLGEDDWKERYYAKKFEAKTKDEQERVRRHVVLKYIEGICWVMRYYYHEVCSWQWFYPYHYAPFASDFYGLDQLEIHFTLGEPFKPFDQLMAVLPAASACALPLSYRKFMTDASSPILDFYPSDFRLDLNGKRRKWQAVCILPFIEESRLLSAVAQVEHELTDDERQRNSLDLDILFVHISHPLADIIIQFSKQNCHPNVLQKIDPKISGGMNGFICNSDKSVWPAEVYSPIESMQMIANNEVISISYKYPVFHCHISKLPEEVILPGKSVGEQEISPPHIWHETVVSKGVSSRRPIPKSISGPHLANLAHRLVSSCYPAKQEDICGYKGPGFRVDAYRLGGIRTKVNAWKKKWSKDNKNFIDDRFKERRSEGEGVPHNTEKLKQSILSERRDGNHAGDDGVKEIRIEIQSKKAKRRLRKRKRSEGFGVPDNNVVELEHSIHRNHSKCETQKMDKCTNVEKLGSCIVGEKRQGYDVHVGTEGEVEIKKQVKSKKRKRRSSRRRQIEADDIYAFREQRSHASDQLGKQIDGNAHKVGANGLEIQPSIELEAQAQIKSKKKKRRSKARNILNNSLEQLESCVLSKQVGCDGNVVGASGLVALSNGKEKKQIDGSPNNSLDKVDVGVLEEPGGGSSDHVGVGAAAEINTAVKSRKRKPRSKKRRKTEDHALPMLESSVLSSCDGNIVGASGLVSPSEGSEKKQLDGLPNKKSLEKVGVGVFREQEGGSGDHVGVIAAAEINTDIKTRKRKPRSKKRRKIEDHALPILDSGVLGKRVGCDGNILGASGLVAPSNGLEKEQLDGIPTKSLEQVRAGVFGVQGGGSCDHGGVGVAAETNTNVKSRKRKPRSKRRRKIEDNALSKPVGCDGNVVGASGLVALSERLEEKQLDSIPNNSPVEVEAVVFRERGGGSGDHVGVGSAAEINREVKSRKRKSKSKRRKKIEDHALPMLDSGVLSKQVCCDGNIVGVSGLVASKWPEKKQLDGIPNNGLEEVEAGVFREQGGGSGDHFGVGATVEINTQIKSKKRKPRSKKRRSEDHALPIMESGVLSKHVGCDGHIVDASGPAGHLQYGEKET
ncbi:hypothetical protein P3X46_005129 [Hevea brasiliensis]|uniref:Uncharacterized protein n=1 Tax=Hevea brasiliensis TaxID=3981 RepID=A0ABQ9N3U4_HEVBR|nr:5'-3' exoribonuclease 2 [Hevea brasiliensis]KAJ9185499.1 hypothetical protein P3X46_005129 [Hevea brasiliensis]